MTLSQQEKETLIFQQKHLVYDDCQLSYKINLKPSLLMYNRLFSSLHAALWTSLAQNIHSGVRKKERQLNDYKLTTNCYV